MRTKMRFSLPLAIGCLIAAPAVGSAAGIPAPLERPAVMSRLASETVLMDVTTAGSRLVAVGERGIVLLSDDSGRTWRQAKLPVSVTLTAVAFPTPSQGWAVGHYGVVLHTADGGETWVRQLDGNMVAALARDAADVGAKEPGADAAAAQRLRDEAALLTKDGPDKPFLDVYFENERSGFVVGAYNLMFRTDDGGETWRYWSDRLDNPGALHLYAMAGRGRSLYLAGEQGLFLRSEDGGQTFTRLETPYEGSYFTLAALSSGDIVVAGLRGNAFHSSDGGVNWQPLAVAAAVSFSAAAVTAEGALLLANQAGQLFVSRDQGRSLQGLHLPPLPPLTSLLPLPDGSLVATTLRGVTRLSSPAGALDSGRTRP